MFYHAGRNITFMQNSMIYFMKISVIHKLFGKVIKVVSFMKISTAARIGSLSHFILWRNYGIFFN